AGALRLVVEGDRAKNHRGELSSEYALTLDPSTSPKRYVFKPIGRATTEPVSRGIYSLGGGTLKFWHRRAGRGPAPGVRGPPGRPLPLPLQAPGLSAPGRAREQGGRSRGRRRPGAGPQSQSDVCPRSDAVRGTATRGASRRTRLGGLARRGGLAAATG